MGKTVQKRYYNNGWIGRSSEMGYEMSSNRGPISDYISEGSFQINTILKNNKMKINLVKNDWAHHI